jgi:hypothetical protein
VYRGVRSRRRTLRKLRQRRCLLSGLVRGRRCGQRNRSSTAIFQRDAFRFSQRPVGRLGRWRPLQHLAGGRSTLHAGDAGRAAGRDQGSDRRRRRLPRVEGELGQRAARPEGSWHASAGAGDRLRRQVPQGPREPACDQDKLFSFFDYPAEHWVHIRTRNPIESAFSTVRLRQRVTKGAGSRRRGLTMAFKLLEMAQQRWRRLNGSELLPLGRAGVQFPNGTRVERDEPTPVEPAEVAA